MAQRASNGVLKARLEILFPSDDILPCTEASALLSAVAEARPADFQLSYPQRPCDLRNSAFEGIPEWEAFLEHYSSCELGNA
jgi:hypothetical protein